MEPIQIIIVVVLVIGLAGLYILASFLNKKTPIPEGCDLPSLGCESCTSTSCSFAKPTTVDELKSEIKQELHKSISEEGGNK